MTAPIICGVRGADRARAVAGVAGTLARWLGRRLELLHVSEPGARPDVGLMRAVLASLDGLLEPPDVVVRLESGDPQERLTAAADEAAALVIGTTEEGLIRRWLRHDVTSAVARQPACPVVVVPPDGGWAAAGGELVASTLVCGIRDRRDVTCARAAADLARRFGGQLELVHVLQPPISSALVMEATPPLVLPEMRAHAEGLLEECAATLAAQLPAAPATRIETGLAGPGLARAAQDRRAGLLAVGSSGRGPLASVIEGEASRYLLRHAGLPVMVVPQGEQELGEGPPDAVTTVS